MGTEAPDEQPGGPLKRNPSGARLCDPTGRRAPWRVAVKRRVAREFFNTTTRFLGTTVLKKCPDAAVHQKGTVVRAWGFSTQVPVSAGRGR